MNASRRVSLEPAARDGPRTASSGPGSTAKKDGPTATNAWARAEILGRALRIGLPFDLTRTISTDALTLYDRLVPLLGGREELGRDLPSATNRYLVPITLAFACDRAMRPIALDRLLRLSGTPSKRTVEVAHQLHARYARLLGLQRLGAGRRARPISETAPFRPKMSGAPGRAAGTDEVRTLARPTPPIPTTSDPTTALAPPLPPEAVQWRELSGSASTSSPTPGKAASGPRMNVNVWARRRITELSRHLGVPDRVRRRALEVYEQVVDLHSARAHAPEGKRLQLSPRLNWSLVFTTIYLGCRLEEYPKDLRTILGPHAKAGTLREMYRLYRFYKRELKLTIKIVDVRTLILSWIDGLDLAELLSEIPGPAETAKLRQRAVALAERAQRASTLRSTSTKLIAAGAFTTALAERNPPSRLSAFFESVARLLHMSEESIRSVVALIAGIL